MSKPRKIIGDKWICQKCSRENDAFPLKCPNCYSNRRDQGQFTKGENEILMRGFQLRNNLHY